MVFTSSVEMSGKGCEGEEGVGTAGTVFAPERLYYGDAELHSFSRVEMPSCSCVPPGQIFDSSGAFCTLTRFFLIPISVIPTPSRVSAQNRSGGYTGPIVSSKVLCRGIPPSPDAV